MSESIADHLSIKTTRFFMKIVGMWRMENKRDRIISNILTTSILSNLFFGVVILIVDLWMSWGNLIAVSYNVPYTTTTVGEFSKLAVFAYNRRKVMAFNEFTENTFWNAKYNRVELEILENCNKMCLRAYGISFVLMQAITWFFIGIGIAENVGRNETDRELPCRIWFDLPLTKTPWFEMAFIFEAFATCSIGICSTIFAVFLFTMNLYAAGHFKILQHNLRYSSEIYRNISRNESDISHARAEIVVYENLKKCIMRHQLLIEYIERVDNLYRWIMLGQTLCGVFQMCFSSFQIVLGAKASFDRTALSIVFFVGSTTQLFLFSWACHTIIEQSLAVAEAAYEASWCDIPFRKGGKLYRQAILVMICRARKACILTAGKFSPMSLDTFASVFNTSISYFTVLRQMQENES